MEIKETKLRDVMLIKPKVIGDNRGYFFEFYNDEISSLLNPNEHFVQDNQSMSHTNVLRGLHLQLAPYTQGKFIRVVSGAVMDVVVDARKNSPTFGQHLTIELNADNNNMLYIPSGFLHGFVTLEDNTIFTYKCSNYYNKESEITVNWNDKDLNINWNCSNPIISEKDKKGISFNDYCNKYLFDKIN
jgi:dTDP-4-dehydrorhamnose 3,5-epimerase